MSTFNAIFEYDLIRKHRLTTAFVIIITPILGGFAIYNLFAGNHAIAMANGILCLLQLLFFIPQERFIKRRLIIRLNLILIGLHFYYNIYFGIQVPEYVVWFTVFPLAVFIFLPGNEAILWCMLFLAGTPPIFYYLVSSGFPLGAGLIIRLHIVYILSTLVLYLNYRIFNHIRSRLLLHEKNLIDEKNHADELRHIAEEAVMFRNRFMAVMSHEIRNPLNVILGMSEFLSEDKDSTDRNDYITIIRETGLHLDSLIRNVLDFSKIDEGFFTLMEHRFSIRNLVASIDKSYRFFFTGKNIIFRVSVSDDVPDVLSGDIVRIRQIISNLVDNAIKFTEAGTIELRIGSHPCDVNGQCIIVITVSDSGIGIPQDKLAGIFDPYEQVYRNIVPTSGAGLGLSICRKLVEEMNGRIDAESVQGKGSVFTAEIRLKIFKDIDPPVESLKSIRRIQSLSILIAEDNSAVRMVLSMILRKAGHHVTEVSNGQEVLDKLGESIFDCILMDIDMPLMNGLQASECIRQGSAGSQAKSIPIIILSGYSDPAMSGTHTECFINDFITKPVDARTLLTAIERNMLQPVRAT